MPINKAYLLFLKRSKYQRDKERAMRNLVRFEGLGANSQLPLPRRAGDSTAPHPRYARAAMAATR
jgi:hypothetical protein